MRAAILIFFLFLFLVKSRAQDSADLKFIEERIRSVQHNDEVYYSDYALGEYYRGCRKYLKRVVPGYNGDTLYLSNNEIRFLKKELRKRIKEKFDDSLFRDSRRKPRDSIVQIIENLNRSNYDSLRSLPGTIPNFRNFKYWAFSFCRPVYFRNNNWMIFYFMYYATSAGEYGLAYYRKSAENWELFKNVCGGAW